MTKNKQKKQSGTIDRVEEGVAVVVTPDPKNPDHSVEIYMPVEDFQDPPKEGDYVTILGDE